MSVDFIIFMSAKPTKGAKASPAKSPVRNVRPTQGNRRPNIPTGKKAANNKKNLIAPKPKTNTELVAQLQEVHNQLLTVLREKYPDPEDQMFLGIYQSDKEQSPKKTPAK